MKINWRKWCDEWLLAGKGILLATHNKRFVVGFLVAFLIFGTLMNLLSGGAGKFQLMGAIGPVKSLEIIFEAFLGVFGVKMIFSEWLPMFLLAMLQGVLIGLIVLLWHDKRKNTANVERAGLITGLIALGAGCPTCGTTLLTPLIVAMLGTSGMAVASTVSGVVTIVAVVLALWSLKRIGLETYVIIMNEKYLAKQKNKAKKE